MKKFLDLQYWLELYHDRERFWRLMILALPAIYLVNVFYHFFTCRHGTMACGMSDFAVILPFYIVLSQFVGHLDAFSAFLLYLFSSSAYLAGVYYLTSWFQQWRLRVKSRPKFVLRRV